MAEGEKGPALDWKQSWKQLRIPLAHEEVTRELLLSNPRVTTGARMLRALPNKRG